MRILSEKNKIFSCVSKHFKSIETHLLFSKMFRGLRESSKMLVQSTKSEGAKRPRMRAQSANPESHFLYIYVSTKHTRAKRASKMWAQSPREQSDQVACRASQKRQEGPSKASIYYWNRMVCLFVCLFVCLYLSSAYSFGPIGMKLGPLEWHGVCEVELCHSFFVVRAQRVSGQRVKFFLHFDLCVSEHFELIETHFFFENFREREACIGSKG